MILETYEALLQAYGAALGAATVKGYPSWGRQVAETPAVALELLAWEATRGRIGQPQAQQSVGYRGWLFARNEPELCTMLEGLLTWHQEHGTLDVTARRVACLLLEVKRHVPESTVQAEEHGVTFLVKTEWT